MPLLPSRRITAHHAATLVLIWSLGTGPGEVIAASADRQQPMTVQAQESSYDGLKQSGRFSGNVILTQGTLLIKADRIDIQTTAGGATQAVAYGSDVRPASFSQKRDSGSNDTIAGSGQTIHYDTLTSVIRFEGQATVKRLVNGQVSDETSGNSITYDSKSEVFKVMGGNSMVSPANPKGMTRTVITPRTDSKTTTPPAPAASSQLTVIPQLGAKP